jgi:hypothetical protein
MKSIDIKGISTWVKWNRAVLELAPSSPGIYVLRLVQRETIKRLIGSSDILYIGCSKRSTIGERLKCHFKTNDALDRVCQEVGEVEVSWRSFVKDENVDLCESELIGRYESEHIELPPLNRTQPLAKWRMLWKSQRPEIQKMMEAAPRNPMLD